MEPLREPDAEVVFSLKATRADGKPKTAKSGYRPEYGIRPDYWTCTHHEFEEASGVSTGQSVNARIWFISPEVYPHTLWIGRQLVVREGARIVGSAIVVRVVNPLMLSLDEGPVDFS
ncbi:MAG: hypothetical protein JNL19_07130 [Burkholderiales bacterium]|nr:hypothetical protein [Burkholderiales bacterium]